MYTIQTSPERKLKLCAIPTCKGKRYDLVHKFPMNNERAQQWIEIIDLPELKKLPIEQIRKRFFICSKHFRSQDYKNSESRSLNTTAYPRLHLKLNDDEASEQCSTNVNVEEFSVQECDYGVQETTIEITETEPHIPNVEKTDAKAIEYIVCSSTNDAPILFRRTRNNGTGITLQDPIQVEATVVPATKPIILKSSLKPTNTISAPKSDPSKFILKRNANYTIEPVRKKIILNESDATKTYCNTQASQKGFYYLRLYAHFEISNILLIFLL